MALSKIYGIYLNNLRWHQIQGLYKEFIPKGKATLKIERIQELLSLWDVLPDSELIDQYLFAGRTSANWYRLTKDSASTISKAKERLAQSLGDLASPRYPRLSEGFSIVHAIEKPGKLYMTLGLANFRDHIIVRDYNLESVPSEYFCFAVLRNSQPTLEIRANENLRGMALQAIIDNLGLQLGANRAYTPLTEEQFMAFKNGIPDSSIKKYKGRSVNPEFLTEIFDLTARQDVDYAADLVQFEHMREQLQDLSLTIVFQHNGSDFPLRLNLITRSIYFPSFVTENAIDYIFEIYERTIMEGHE